MVKKILLTLFLVTNIFYVSADRWEGAKVTFTYSSNREYMLKIYPRQYLDIQLLDKTIRQRKKAGKKIDPDMYMIACYAVLYQISNPEVKERWVQPLVNYSAPVKTIVANDGKSVITIDDWGMAGARHAMAIYDENGELLRDFSLEDISPFPVEQYSGSLTIRLWYESVTYLDNNRVEIRFRNKNGEEKTRVFNIEERAFEDEISISLQ